LASYVDGRTQAAGIQEWGDEEDILSNVEEVTGGWKNLLNNDVHDPCSSAKVITVY